MELNSAQSDAVTRSSRRLLLLAGPGTGKTEALTERIVHFLRDRGVLPGEVIMFTYTNKAAQNMSQRIRNKLSLPAPIRSGTFHSLCYRFLREEICAKGILPAYQVLAEHHALRLRKQAAHSFIETHGSAAALLRRHRVLPHELLELYERKTKLNLQSDFLRDADHELHLVVGELAEYARQMSGFYQSLKEQYQVFDFNDLLHHLLQVLSHSEEIRRRLQWLFPHVYVDEYQDTNRVQVAILQQLVAPESWLTVVGDDTQSIYAFQGSEVANIRNFARDFPGAEVVVLNENYRSSPRIIAYVNALNATCQGALAKTLISRGPVCDLKPRLAIFSRADQEAEWIVQEIQRLIQTQRVELGEIAILTRLGSVAGAVELALQMSGLPFTRTGGIKLADLKHIQMFISFLELLENPLDWLAWETLLPAIPNIGAHFTQVILRDLQCSNWSWTQPPVFSLGRGKRLASVMNFWREMIAASQGSKAKSVRLYLEEVLPFFQHVYARYFHGTPRMVRVTTAHKLPDQMEDHIQDIRSYIIELSTSYIGLVRDFISEVAANRDEKVDQRGISVSTIHSAKGLEWTVVFVLGNIEGIFPARGFGLERNDPEEERRLFYVACSRAKQYLYLSAAYEYLLPHKVKGAVSGFAEDPCTRQFLEKIKEPNGNPFYAVNPHRLDRYWLPLPP